MQHNAHDHIQNKHWLWTLLRRKAGNREADVKTLFLGICILDGGGEECNITRARQRDHVHMFPTHIWNTAQPRRIWRSSARLPRLTLSLTWSSLLVWPFQSLLINNIPVVLEQGFSVVRILIPQLRKISLIASLAGTPLSSRKALPAARCRLMSSC